MSRPGTHCGTPGNASGKRRAYASCQAESDPDTPTSCRSAPRCGPARPDTATGKDPVRKTAARPLPFQACAADEIEYPICLAPELWIAEICRINAHRRADDRIIFIFLKRDAIVTPSQTLRLHAVSILLTHACVQKIQPLPYNKRAAGKTAALFIHVIRLTWYKRRRQLRPMQQIPAHRVAPAGLAPGEANGLY